MTTDNVREAVLLDLPAEGHPFMAVCAMLEGVRSWMAEEQPGAGVYVRTVDGHYQVFGLVAGGELLAKDAADAYLARRGG